MVSRVSPGIRQDGLSIISEFSLLSAALSVFRPIVSVLGSARTPSDHPHYRLAYDIGKRLSVAGFSVMTGGGMGIMKAANEGAQQGKSASIGLTVHPLDSMLLDPVTHHEFRVDQLFLRKKAFIECSERIICLPGGFGTLDEWVEILLHNQYQPKHARQILFVGTLFWQPVLDWFRQHLLANNLISETDLQSIFVVETVEEILGHLSDPKEMLSLNP